MAPDRSAGPSGQMPRAAVSSSRAVSIAVVKLAWSGSVPGQVSTAETMATCSNRWSEHRYYHVWVGIRSAHPRNMIQMVAVCWSEGK